MAKLGLVGRAALGAFVAALVVLSIVGSGILLSESRADLAAVSDRLTDRSERVVAADPGNRAQARVALRGAGHARIFDAEGELLAGSGSSPVWQAGGPGVIARLAGTGVQGSARDGAYEVTAALPSGGTVALRESVPTAHGSLSGAGLAVLATLVLGGALMIGLVGALVARSQRRRLARIAHAADAIGVSARHGLLNVGGSREWTSLTRAVSGAADRTEDFQAAAEVRFDAMAAALTPLSLAAAARTPSGAILRNAALDSLCTELNGSRADLEDAINHGLNDNGAVARRVPLPGGRTLDVDAWSVPGGRMVSVTDRSEQQRAEQLRSRLAGGAMRTLRPPITEIQAAAGELFRATAASEAAPVQRILRSADRLERLTASLLRGGPHDPHATPVERRAVGLAGLLWETTRKWDAGLKPRALRVELDLASDLPAVDTDPALLEEILDELVENAAKFSRRGDSISVTATLTPERRVKVGVCDSGDGFSPEVAARAVDPFYRGPDADTLPGAGLGLGVARALAGRIGAELDIAPGPGGAVYISLPTVAEPSSAPVAA